MTYEYDKNGNITRALDGELEWVWDYDDNGNLVRHKSPSTEWVKEYDDQNRENRYVCGNRIVTTVYDENGTAMQTEVESA